jgi:TM2 domain-containing membrane protein YozV
MHPKSVGTAYLLWFFLGFLGIHKFYLDKAGTGILYLFTFGLLGIGLLVDLFTLGEQVRTYNQSLATSTARLQGDTGMQQAPAAPAQREPATPEKQILLLAGTQDAFTLRDLLRQTDLDLETAETTLEKLLDRGLLRQQMSPDGELRYVER